MGKSVIVVFWAFIYILIQFVIYFHRFQLINKIFNRRLSKSNIKDTRHFIPKPKWHAVTSTSLSHYKLTLVELLCKLDIPDDVLSCSNVFCEFHSSFISSLHEYIVSSLVTAAQESITFTQPYSKPNRTHPGWNEFVKPFQSEALDWHSVWINSGRPQSGFVYGMVW